MFNPYEKIAEDFKAYQFSEADYRLFKKTDWIVTEKIHGANFSVHTNGKIVRFANRKAILEENEEFFDYQTVIIPQVDKVFKVFEILKQQNPPISEISIYGELFGGEYPHPAVPANSAILPVQTGIYYSPQLEWQVFDIAFQSNHQRQYLDFKAMSEVCAKVDLFYTEALFIGKYENALSFNIQFESTIPAKLDLPKLTQANLAEGVVIKPAKSFYLETSKGKIRPVLKQKIVAFSEQKYQQAQKWDYQQLKFEEKLVKIKNEIENLATQNRLNNALSKIGRVKSNDTVKILKIKQLIREDLLITFQEQNLEIWQNISGKEQKTLNETIENESDRLLKEFFSINK